MGRKKKKTNPIASIALLATGALLSGLALSNRSAVEEDDSRGKEKRRGGIEGRGKGKAKSKG